jgi:outer membrane protein assembly factor BamB
MANRRRFLQVAGASVATALSGCAFAPNSGSGIDPLGVTDLDETATAQIQGGIRNHGSVDRTVPDAVAVDWTLPVNRGDHTAAKSTPVSLPEGDVLIAADTGILRRVTTAGEVVWETTLTDATRGMHGTPAVANGTAYVGAYDGVVSAVDLASGERVWRTKLGDAIGSSPVYYNGICYISVEYNIPSGSVAAVDAASGDRLWIDRRPTNHPHSTVGIDREAGRLVVGSNDGICYGWTFPGLERVWTFETEGAIKGPVAVADGKAIFGSWDNHVYAVDLADGTLAWDVATDMDVMSAPAVADGTVYVGSHDSNLYALALEDGSEQWRYDTGGWIIGAVTATRESVLAGAYDGRMYAVDADSGERRWRADGRGQVTSGALVTDDAVYFAERATPDEPGLLYRLVPA